MCELRCPTCDGHRERHEAAQAEDPVIFRSDRAKLTPELYRELLDEAGEYLFMDAFYNSVSRC